MSPQPTSRNSEDYKAPLHSQEPRYGIFGIFSTCLLILVLWLVPQSWVKPWLEGRSLQEDSHHVPVLTIAADEEIRLLHLQRPEALSAPKVQQIRPLPADPSAAAIRVQDEEAGSEKGTDWSYDPTTPYAALKEMIRPDGASSPSQDLDGMLDRMDLDLSARNMARPAAIDTVFAVVARRNFGKVSHDIFIRHAPLWQAQADSLRAKEWWDRNIMEKGQH